MRDDLYFSVTPQQWDAYATIVAGTVRLSDSDDVGYIGGQQWRIADPALVHHLVGETSAKNADLRRLAYAALESVVRYTGDPAASQALLVLARGTPARSDVRHLLAALKEVTEPAVLTGTIIPAVLAERRHPAHYEACKLAGRCPDEDVVPVLLDLAEANIEVISCDVVRTLTHLRGDEIAPRVLALLESTRSEMRAVALRCLEAHGVDVAELLLTTPKLWKGNYSFVASRALTRIGDHRHVPQAATRLGNAVIEEAKRGSSPSELQDLVPFLARFGDEPAAARALAVVKRKWDVLTEEAQSWLGAHHPELVPPAVLAPPWVPRVPIVRTHTPEPLLDLDALVAAVARAG